MDTNDFFAELKARIVAAKARFQAHDILRLWDIAFTPAVAESLLAHSVEEVQRLLANAPSNPATSGYTMTPADVLTRLNISLSTLVLWERKGKLVPMRSATGVRMYKPEDVEKIANLREKPDTTLLMRASQVMEELNISYTTLRSWDMQRILSPVARGAQNARLYAPEDVARMKAAIDRGETRVKPKTTKENHNEQN